MAEHLDIKSLPLILWMVLLQNLDPLITYAGLIYKMVKYQEVTKSVTEA